MDIAVALADREAAPAARTFVDPADDAMLDRVTDPGAVIGVGAERARVARPDDRGAAVAKQRDQHPALRSVGVLDQPPMLIFFDHPDRQVAALVEPHARIILAR